MKVSKRHWVWIFLLLGLTFSALGVIWFVFASNRASGSLSAPTKYGSSLENIDDYGVVPDFTLIERSGRKITLADLSGKIWIANFFYSQCTETCPMQTANMAALQKEFASAPNVRFVSFSVDPEHDTPAFLREYAARYNVDPERWLFLTGSNDVIYDLARNGFKLVAYENPTEYQHVHPDGTIHIHKTAAGERVMHSSRFIVIDGEGRIRAYFRGEDRESLARLPSVVRTLLHQN
ncbi:MAG TPA: SCO family protein [Anaerolineae bacterium]|nr:SCO family protein [Anaerolineae bacterium]